MEISLHVPAEPVDRHSKLKAFLRGRRITNKVVALSLGISQTALHMMLAREVAAPNQVKYLEELVKAGIPRELLPTPPDGWPADSPSVREQNRSNAI